MEKNIVLVIGAGVSHDFEPEMGLGISLVHNICKRVYEPNEPMPYLSLVLKGLGYDDNIRCKFQNELQKYIDDCSTPSIDSFINQCNDEQYKEIAKFMIAAHVLGYEQECCKNATFNGENTWLQKLGVILNENGLLGGIPDQSINLSIITFNYDRLIEEFLYRKFGKKAEAFANNNVIHFYNQLSYLPWQHDLLKKIADANQKAIDENALGNIKPLPFLDFGHPNYDSSRIKEREHDILLIYDSERIEENEQRKTAKQKINSANNVYFLGFAYDHLNMEKLGIKEMSIEQKEKIKWILNFYDSSAEEVNRINGTYFNNKANTTKETCLDFLEKHLQKDFSVI